MKTQILETGLMNNLKLGFSYIELLIALTVLSIALIPMLTTQANNQKNLSSLSDKTYAQIVANNTLIKFKLIKANLVPGIYNGFEFQSGKEFSWNVNIYKNDKTNLTMFDVIVSRENDNLYSITGFRENLN